jgi:hypothetical protein
MSARTITILVAAAASGAGFAQPEIAATDPQAELVRTIAETRAAEGPTSTSLIDPLRDLALLYEADGDHTLAIVAVEEARYITRVHQGLSSADEALLLRQQIRSEEALGNHEGAWNLAGDMVTIARKHYDDIRMVPLFRELAEDRAAALEEYRAGGYPPEIELGCYYRLGNRDGVDGVSCSSGTSDAVRRQFRASIRTYYADAIQVLVESGEYASPELRDLEKQALRYSTFPQVNFCRERSLDALVALPLLGSCLEPRGNVGGWVSLVRLIAYEVRSGAPAGARANAVAELADWHLVSTRPERRRFEGGDAASRIYERAYREAGQDDEARASIFSPEVPVTLPTYLPNPFASAAQSPRYIDIAFDITNYGVGDRIEILDTSKGATRAERRDLIRLVEATTFRPRFVDGELAAAAPVVLRYPLSP